MATTWTCTDSHTHDVSVLGWKHPQGIAAGYDVECRTCGDKVTDLNYTPDTVSQMATATVHKKLKYSDKSNVAF